MWRCLAEIIFYNEPVASIVGSLIPAMSQSHCFENGSVYGLPKVPLTHVVHRSAIPMEIKVPIAQGMMATGTALDYLFKEKSIVSVMAPGCWVAGCVV